MNDDVVILPICLVDIHESLLVNIQAEAALAASDFLIRRLARRLVNTAGVALLGKSERARVLMDSVVRSFPQELDPDDRAIYLGALLGAEDIPVRLRICEGELAGHLVLVANEELAFDCTTGTLL